MELRIVISVPIPTGLELLVKLYESNGYRHKFHSHCNDRTLISKYFNDWTDPFAFLMFSLKAKMIFGVCVLISLTQAYNCRFPHSEWKSLIFDDANNEK